ncbi:MAG: hypothetical protein QOG72_2170 [Sphingomonadales bacterium]|jgi:hypothetical protein|nr:hypothetical protein [Sphingomonadales bacterium]
MGEHYKVPEIAMLALNGAAITALTAFWDVINGDKPEVFGVAFIAFVLGAMFAAYAAYCRYVGSEDTADPQTGSDPWYWSKSPTWLEDPADAFVPPAVVGLLALTAMSLPYVFDESYPVTATITQSIGVILLIALPVALRSLRGDQGRSARAIYRGATLLSFALFIGGTLLTMGTLAALQADNVDSRPGSGSSSKEKSPGGASDPAPGEEGFQGGGGTSGGGGASASYGDISIGGSNREAGKPSSGDQGGDRGGDTFGGSGGKGSGATSTDVVNLTVLCSARSGPPRRLVRVVPRTRPPRPATIACPAVGSETR